MKPSHVISILVGVILIAAGVFLLTTRRELALELVGQELAMKELLVGGSSLRNASQLVMASGLGSLVVGLLLALFGMALGLRRQ